MVANGSDEGGLRMEDGIWEAERLCLRLFLYLCPLREEKGG